MLPISLIVLLSGSLFLFTAVQKPIVQTTYASVPTVTSIVTGDANSDGTVDRMVLTFSEAVSGTTNGLGFTVSGDCTTIDSASLTDTDEITFVVSGCTASNTAITPTLTYNDAVGDLLDDATDTDPVVSFSTASTDGAKPVVLSAAFVDGASNDGKLDLITTVWSENLSAVADGTADWALTSGANFTNIVEGTVECNNGGAAANECDYNFTTDTVKTNVGDLSLAYTAGTSVTDGANTANSVTLTSASTPALTDSASPVIVSVTLSKPAKNILTFVYSEPMNVTDGASTATKGDTTTAGTVAGFGSFATAGNVTVATTKNTVGGNGTASLTVTLAGEAGAALNPGSTTEPSGVFTEVASAELTATVGGHQVNTGAADPTATGGGSWDLTGPTITNGNISIAGGTGTGGAYKVGDTVTATWNNAAGGDNNTDLSGAPTADLSQFGGGAAVVMTDTAACGGTNADNVWEACYTLVAGAIDATNRNVSITATDVATNSSTTADTTNATVDSIAPAVTNGNISIAGGTGTGGAYKVGDTVTATWNNAAGGDNNTDLSGAPTADLSQFGGGAAVVMTDTAACGGTNANNVWEACYTITGAEGIDNTNRNVSVTATDDAGNTTTTADTTNATVDTIAPSITNNGTLTITTDNSVVGVAALNNGTSNQDKVTQSAVTLAAADGDSETTNFTALTGQAAVANGSQSGVLVPGAIDNAAQTFTITVTDNAGNTATTATDAISVDNTAPNITANGTLTITTDNGVGGVAALNNGASNQDKVTQSAVTLAAADGDSETTNFTALTGQAAVANGSETTVLVAGALDNAAQTFTISVTDNAGNISTASTDAISVDNVAPTVANNGTLTITTDNGVGGVAALNNGTSNQDRVTQSAVTAGAADGDVATIDLGALTGQGTLVAGVQSGIVLPGALDNAAATFTITLTDNGGNTVTAVSDTISVDNIVPNITANGTLTITTDNGVGGVAALNDGVTNQDQVTQSAVTISNTDSDTTTINLTALTGQAALAATTQSTVVVPGAIDSAAQTFTITVTDNGGNISTTTSDAISVDNIAPTVTTARISVTGATGTGGAFKNGDAPVARWDVTSQGETDTLTSVSFNADDFRTGDTALAGSLGSGVYTASLSGALSAQDDANNNVTVTVTDNGGNITATTGTNNYTVDSVAPSVTDNGTLTISTDNGVVGVAALNNGTSNQDKVTQSAITLAVADGDTTTVNFTTLTGQAALAPATESTVVTAGALDNAAATFTITVTDNAGNTITTATDAISVDNIAPVISTAGNFTISTDAGTLGMVEIADAVTYNAPVMTSADADTATVNIATLTGVGGDTAVAAATAKTVGAGALNSATQTFAELVTDNGGNTVTGTTQSINVYNLAAAALVGADVQPGSLGAAESQSTLVSFTTANILAANGKIRVIFPSGFNVSGVNMVSNSGNIDGTYSIAISGQSVVLTRLGNGTAVPAGTSVTLLLGPVTNPGSLGATGTYAIQVMNSANAVIDSDMAVASDTIVAATPVTTTTSGGGGGGGGGGGNSKGKTTNIKIPALPIPESRPIVRPSVSRPAIQPRPVSRTVINKHGRTLIYYKNR